MIKYKAALGILESENEADISELIYQRSQSYDSGAYDYLKNKIDQYGDGINSSATLIDLVNKYAPDSVDNVVNGYGSNLDDPKFIISKIGEMKSSMNLHINSFDEYLYAASFFLALRKEQILLHFFLKDFSSEYDLSMFFGDKSFIENFKSVANGYAKGCIVKRLMALTPPQHLILNEPVASETLCKVFEKLKGKFLAPETTEDVFLSLFGRGTLVSSYAKIKWIGTIAALRYFVQQLRPNIVKGPNNHWKVIAAKFIDTDGNSFKATSFSKGKNAGAAAITTIDKIMIICNV